MTDLGRPGPPLRIALRPLAPHVRSYLATESGGATLLLGASVLALLWANSPWGGTYHAFWDTWLGVDVGGWSWGMDLHAWVNDATMAVFFLVIGLEISREATTGELRDRRAIAVPALGALGGLLVPALIFLAFNAGTEAAHGWGIVMSTDTAFLVGVLALFGPRCPDQLRLFLLTLAVVDDIGAITVMAVAYTDQVNVPGLLVAAALVGVLVWLRWVREWRLAPYVATGVALWFAVHASGVHATLAGVLVGLLVPASLARREEVVAVHGYAKRLAHETTAEQQHLTEVASRAAVPANDRLQRVLHPWSAYAVVPLFGLANAGVRVDAETLRAAATSPLTIGTAVALVVGNAVGIFAASSLALRLGLGDLPGRVRYSHLLGGAMLAGIGFTISLFITELAFDDEVLVEQAKIGILVGSAVSAVLGSLVLRSMGERWPLCSPASPDGPPAALPAGDWANPSEPAEPVRPEPVRPEPVSEDGPPAR
ncbi:Na+/H+ antiporter NhaA [Xylanimonas oleitrophica]|uniref:Na(+)/H(+) antiporter NhaA n=1 Tax=Xylanimonas oleitrophica TaxID=2607479 RepID=A0A2W5WU69_9MICO|nr:Na+/H+ antiporter NhaA [Xylanimonas oleitrophica]PZR55019.1 Na+/H+ antiporter NhaA [Xylanimonas oleitrophica]